jgi:hypothetical protein
MVFFYTENVHAVGGWEGKKREGEWVIFVFLSSLSLLFAVFLGVNCYF